MTALLVFIHVFSCVLVLGCLFASLLLIIYHRRTLTTIILKKSLLTDAAAFPIMITAMVSGAFMVKLKAIPAGTPWIIAAYLFFFSICITWFIQTLLKLKQMLNPSRSFLFYFYATQCVIIILFMLTLHDAILQKTWLTFL